MKKEHVIGTICMAVLLAVSPLVAMADGSEEETPKEEQDFKRNEPPVPEAVKAHLAYVEDLDRRYPDTSKVDPERFMAEEGEKAALIYCRALGFDGPCEPDQSGQSILGRSGFVALDEERAAARVGRYGWFDWLFNLLYSVGVIPDKASCPSPHVLVQMHMDDEDRRNANSRWGWIGATASSSNTTWRFCRLSWDASFAFKPLANWGNQYDYAVQNLGMFCPPGSRRVLRRHDNEDWANANWSSGGVFPSFNLGGNWWTYTCQYDGGTPTPLMSSFPTLGFGYGVFSQTNLPWPYALANGYVYQDDEDFLNLNFWIGSPDAVMGGGNNTWRGLSRVK
ncbi:hypothetical protein V1318_16200 [Lysobacter sp. CCNWLW3]|uniref:hypothetical protein n=1 Tax=unclassified Lysobacter TaxID=2635362 RepID=UPI002FCED17C